MGNVHSPGESPSTSSPQYPSIQFTIPIWGQTPLVNNIMKSYNFLTSPTHMTFGDFIITPQSLQLTSQNDNNTNKFTNQQLLDYYPQNYHQLCVDYDKLHGRDFQQGIMAHYYFHAKKIQINPNHYDEYLTQTYTSNAITSLESLLHHDDFILISLPPRLMRYNNTEDHVYTFPDEKFYSHCITAPNSFQSTTTPSPSRPEYNTTSPLLLQHTPSISSLQTFLTQFLPLQSHLSLTHPIQPTLQGFFNITPYHVSSTSTKNAHNCDVELQSRTQLSPFYSQSHIPLYLILIDATTLPYKFSMNDIDKYTHQNGPLEYMNDFCLQLDYSQNTGSLLHLHEQPIHFCIFGAHEHLDDNNDITSQSHLSTTTNMTENDTTTSQSTTTTTTTTSTTTTIPQTLEQHLTTIFTLRRFSNLFFHHFPSQSFDPNNINYDQYQYTTISPSLHNFKPVLDYYEPITDPTKRPVTSAPISTSVYIGTASSIESLSFEPIIPQESFHRIIFPTVLQSYITIQQRKYAFIYDLMNYLQFHMVIENRTKLTSKPSFPCPPSLIQGEYASYLASTYYTILAQLPRGERLAYWKEKNNIHLFYQLLYQQLSIITPQNCIPHDPSKSSTEDIYNHHLYCLDILHDAIINNNLSINLYEFNRNSIALQFPTKLLYQSLLPPQKDPKLQHKTTNQNDLSLKYMFHGIIHMTYPADYNQLSKYKDYHQQIMKATLHPSQKTVQRDINHSLFKRVTFLPFNASNLSFDIILDYNNGNSIQSISKIEFISPLITITNQSNEKINTISEENQQQCQQDQQQPEQQQHESQLAQHKQQQQNEEHNKEQQQYQQITCRFTNLPSKSGGLHLPTDRAANATVHNLINTPIIAKQLQGKKLYTISRLPSIEPLGERWTEIAKRFDYQDQKLPVLTQRYYGVKNTMSHSYGLYIIPINSGYYPLDDTVIKQVYYSHPDSTYNTTTNINNNDIPSEISKYNQLTMNEIETIMNRYTPEFTWQYDMNPKLIFPYYSKHNEPRHELYLLTPQTILFWYTENLPYYPHRDTSLPNIFFHQQLIQYTKRKILYYLQYVLFRDEFISPQYFNELWDVTICFGQEQLTAQIEKCQYDGVVKLFEAYHPIDTNNLP